MTKYRIKKEAIPFIKEKHAASIVFGLGDANEAEPCALALVAPNPCYKLGGLVTENVNLKH